MRKEYYRISHRTPATNWRTIHTGLDFETACYVMADIADKYEAKWTPEDGYCFNAEENGDLHEFQITGFQITED